MESEKAAQTTSRRRNTGIVFFPAYDWAISPTHPEREERLLYTQDQLREEGVFDLPTIHEYRPEIASLQDITRTHFCFPSPRHVVTDSHLIAAGGALRIAELVMAGKIDNGFALVRPPGHHGMKSVHGNRGFCNINNEAVMIEYLREHHGTKRIAVVDTDCHHGDGTQDIYLYDPNILYISLHQDGKTLFPGSGFLEERGEGNGRGTTVNIPLPPHTSDAGFLHALNTVVMPILDDFSPELIINSAGQDNHFSDPITNMRFSAYGYAELNSILSPDICVLEGGYSIRGALPYVNLGIVLAMTGEDYSYVREPDYNPRSLKESARTMDEVKKNCELALQYYYEAKEDRRQPDSDQCGSDHRRSNHRGSDDRSEGIKTVSRERSIFYDTAMIQENRKDTVSVCPDESCPGYRLIVTSSRVQSLSAGIEIPISCCDLCYKEALSIIDHLTERTGPGKEYAVLNIINRRDKEYYALPSA